MIGLGLIGGSFARALRKKNISAEIAACDLDEENLRNALDEGIIDEILNLDETWPKLDFIVLSTPIGAYDKIIKKISHKIHNDTIIIDLGSVKNLKINLNNFVACHPIAGSQNNGFENSTAELFLEKKFIICPDKSTKDKEIISIVENVAKKIGCNVDFIDSRAHDEIYALVSHLPQFLSFLTKEFSPANIKDEFFAKAFRLDNSSPELWLDIFKINEKNIEKFYTVMFENLEESISKLSGSDFSINQSEEINFDTEFFENNFAPIFFRALIALSYLEIPEIKTYQSYVGTGFLDFTSIIKVLNYDQNKLAELIKINRAKIIKIFDLISS